MGNFKISEVMFVDDDAIVRLVGSKILKSIHFDKKISQFENGKVAIDEIQDRVASNRISENEGPTLILLDINMPTMDAWGFLDAFQMIEENSKKHFLISIITSSIDSADRTRAFLYPDVLDYIQKPLSGKHVIDFLVRHDLYEE